MDTPQIERDAFSVAEAAQRLGISRAHIYNQIVAGKLRTLKIGRRRLVPARALIEFLEGRTARKRRDA
jgi:excisionase family DNA binding protein